jgi:histidine kinase/DNA gyrase B/HSP90-like ATPase
MSTIFPSVSTQQLKNNVQDWTGVPSRITVGKDVLELLSSSMYLNPLAIYREYIQNCADSIDEARATGLLEISAPGKVDFLIDQSKRSIKICDNGIGLSADDFLPRLLSLGNSKKRGSHARGFRGVGRLAGLGYCQEIIFRGRSAASESVTELRWDCRVFKSILRSDTFAGDLKEVVSDIVTTRSVKGGRFPSHFFEVELLGIIRHGNDLLLNEGLIRAYLSQVAPVPMPPNFPFSTRIQEHIGRVNATTIHIFLNGAETPLYRPHVPAFEVRKGVSETFCDVEFIDIPGEGGTLVATGWILHHDYLGAIPSALGFKGLRVRVGNMQIGDATLLDGIFPESRFNGWSVGEFHVLDRRILPNGRRDYFEQNVPFRELMSQLAPIARDLSRRCRINSMVRNYVKQFESLREAAENNLLTLRQGAVSSRTEGELRASLKKTIGKMEKTCKSEVLPLDIRRKLQVTVARLKRRLENCAPKKNPLRKLSKQERKMCELIFSAIYKCSPNSAMARQLVDRVINEIK